MYITLEQLKEFLGIPESDTSKDDILNGIIASVQGVVDRYLGYSLNKKEYTERVQTKKSKVLRVSAAPVLSVKSLSFSSVDYSEGNIIYINDAPQGRRVIVKYEAGYDTIPGDVITAMLQSSKTLYEDIESDGELDIKSKKIDTLAITYFSPEEHTEGKDVRKLSTLTSVLSSYKILFPKVI